MKNLLYILISLTVLTSCKSAKPTVETHRTVTDSIITEIRYETKWDTIRIPGDTIKLTVPIKDLSESPLIKTSASGRLSAAIKRVKDDIEVQCLDEESIKIIESQNKIIETLTKHLETKETVLTKTEYKTPWYSKILAGIGTVVLILLAVKFIKPF